MLDPLAPKVYRVLLARQVRQGRKAFKGMLAQQDPKVYKGLLAPLVRQVLTLQWLAQLDQPEQLASQVQLGPQELRV